MKNELIRVKVSKIVEILKILLKNYLLILEVLMVQNFVITSKTYSWL